MSNRKLAFKIVNSAATLTRQLDGALSMIKGITFSEYQLLAALKSQPDSKATRVSLAGAVNLTPSGITRALKPLEKIGYVETVRDDRDARKSLASLTPAGIVLVEDADGVIDDTLDKMSTMNTANPRKQQQLIELLSEFSGT